MFIVWCYYDLTKTISIIDTNDLVIETYNYSEVLFLAQQGVKIFGLNCKLIGSDDNPILDFLFVENYRIFLVNEDKDTYSFLINDKRYGFLKDLLVLRKNDTKKLFDLLKEFRDRHYLNIYKIDYKLYKLLYNFDKDTNLYNVKTKLLTGETLTDKGLHNLFSLDYFLKYLVSDFCSNNTRNYQRYFVVYISSVNDLSYIQSLDCRIDYIDKYLYGVTFCFKNKESKFLSKIKY